MGMGTEETQKVPSIERYRSLPSRRLGIGAVGGTTGGQMSYQSGGPAMGMGAQMGGGANMGAQQPQVGTGAPSNPFVSDGYGY